MSDIPNILVADDNESDRLALASAIETAGYRVFQAIDAGTARRVVHEHNIDAAFIDHLMTPHDGVEFARYMALDKISLPMYLVTHEDDSDLLTEATRLGFIGLLKKPVSPERAVKAVERALKLKSINNNEE